MNSDQANAISSAFGMDVDFQSQLNDLEPFLPDDEFGWNLGNSEQGVYHSQYGFLAPSPGQTPYGFFSPYTTNPAQPTSPTGFVATIEESIAEQEATVPLCTTFFGSHSLEETSAVCSTNQVPLTITTRRPKYSPLDWEDRRVKIQQLYITEKKSLNDTMAIMTQDGFSPSEKQYKEKFKEWQWCKYISTETIKWAMEKAVARNLEEEKDTIFVIAGREWTLERVEQRAKRSGWRRGTQLAMQNVPTPRGLQYWTPSEASENQTPGSTSFQDHQIQSPEAIHRWTTAPESSHQLTTQRLCLGWNGLTKEGAMQLFKNAQEDDQLGRSDDAEQKFQQVLIALDNLLPPNHPDANSVAYTLAAFYARHHRMKEADDILDKMTQRQAECNGLGNKAMTDHVLRVVNLLNSWYRPEDALAFLEKASYYLGRGEAQISLSSNPVVSNTAPPQRQQSIDNSNSCIAPEQSQILINDQMNSTVSKAIIRDESAESLLLKIIEQCDGNVTISASQNMRARSQLIEFYHKADKVSDALSHLSKANTLFHSIWTYNVTITKDLMEASTILVSRYLKSAQYETADHMFHTMQICVANVCGPHHSFTIWLLIQIGIIYQHEHRWSNAEARFEQALAASMTANGLCDPQTKALEEALENGYYSEMELEASNFRTTLASQGVLVNPAIQQLVI